MTGDLDRAYVLARRVLLDVLEVLAEHRGAVILVGAQAIYLHTGDGDLATAPYTTDGDLALNPSGLGPIPLLDQLLRDAGFIPSPSADQIGTWIGPDRVPVDLLVPAELAGPGRRAARLGPHGDRVARRARGLEAALVDHQEVLLTALDPDDTRRIWVRVASPAALLIAKLHKLADRQHSPRRQDDKDALDIYRLLQSATTESLTQGIRTVLSAPVSGAVTEEALTHLAVLFGSDSALGSQMAARAVGLLDDPETIAASCAVLAQDLLEALGRNRL
jgi:hypothetical protein